MSYGFSGYDGPPDGEVTLQAKTTDGWLLATTVPDVSLGFAVEAVCARCEAVIPTGTVVSKGDLPLSRDGRWRHPGCGGMGELPKYYFLTDRRTGDQIDMYRGLPRQRLAVSVITAAELLRLSQAARAVQRGEDGAEQRLDRVLAEAPEPLSRLRSRMKPGDWIALAGVTATIVVGLLTLLKDDGSVTPEQLLHVVETVIEQQSEQQEQPASKAEDRAHQSGAGEKTSAVDGPGHQRKWLIESPDDDRGVGQPND